MTVGEAYELECSITEGTHIEQLDVSRNGKKVKMATVLCQNPLAIPTCLTAVPVGCYEEKSDYIESKFPSLFKTTITR